MIILCMIMIIIIILYITITTYYICAYVIYCILPSAVAKDSYVVILTLVMYGMDHPSWAIEQPMCMIT